MKNQTFPQINKNNTNEFELSAGKSVGVLAKIKGFAEPAVAYYFHSFNNWQSPIVCGEIEIEEWWPIPTKGTGTKPNSETNLVGVSCGALYNDGRSNIQENYIGERSKVIEDFHNNMKKRSAEWGHLIDSKTGGIIAYYNKQ
ncbi:TPA: hypothetical protein I7730_15920 [Vibrio vulnificus]|uniref:Uncharacterized protein n=1 Tax=Vibrio vulnificus TaxID=672 RepID=A0A8H9TGN8_VIBVL|nr:hypothetical protein [Vibrio vulnificus]HAS8541270.1 hypothetical protein [Vibrio vulnificus]